MMPYIKSEGRLIMEGKWERKLTQTDWSDLRFGLRDAKGRSIGANIYLYDAEWIELPEDARMWWPRKQGKFAARFQASRDGKDFGSFQKTRFFNTPAERTMAVATYTIEARKRAEKTGAK
jgi:hypothetical protein